MPIVRTFLLVLGRHRERGHDHDEDEEVVDRQALLDDVAGEALRAGVPAADRPEHDAEEHGDRDVEERPRERLAEADGVGPAGREPEVEREEREDEADGRRPAGGGDVDHAASYGVTAAAYDASR